MLQPLVPNSAGTDNEEAGAPRARKAIRTELVRTTSKVNTRSLLESNQIAQTTASDTSTKLDAKHHGLLSCMRPRIRPNEGLPSTGPDRGKSSLSPAAMKPTALPAWTHRAFMESIRSIRKIITIIPSLTMS